LLGVTKFVVREDLPLSHFVTPYQSRNRDNTQVDYNNFPRSNFVTPNNPQDFQRSINQIQASSSPINREDPDVNRGSDLRNSEYINHLIQNLVTEAQTNNINVNNNQTGNNNYVANATTNNNNNNNNENNGNENENGNEEGNNNNGNMNITNFN